MTASLRTNGINKAIVITFNTEHNGLVEAVFSVNRSRGKKETYILTFLSCTDPFSRISHNLSSEEMKFVQAEARDALEQLIASKAI